MTPNNNLAKKKKQQRVSYNDALAMLENDIKNYRSKHDVALTFVEDYAGGSDEFVNRRLVETFLKKITR
jgi:hypothetical protein